METTNVAVLKDTVRPFMRKSTIGGLNNSARSEHYLWTIYWVVLFTIGVILTAVMVSGIVKDYYEYHVIITSDLEYIPSLAFPAVTVCNLNRINCLNLYAKLQNTTVEYESTNLSFLRDEMEQLQAIYTLVGCDLQACNVFSTAIPDVRSDEANDGAAENFAILQCQSLYVEPVFQYRNWKACYYLYQMFHYDPYYNHTPFDSFVQQQSNCTLSLACLHYTAKIQPLVASGAFSTLYSTGSEIGSVCATQSNNGSSQANGTNTGNGRRKRQAGGSQQSEASYTYNISKLEDEFLSKFMALDPTVRLATGNLFPQINIDNLQWQQPGIISECTFLGEDCTREELWYQFSDPTYGNCFGFNWALGQANSTNGSTVRNVTLTGTSNGLELELFVDQFNYMQYGLSPKAGFRIVVHNPNYYPLMDEEGIDLAPATLTSVAVQLTNITRLPDPFEGHCFDFWNQTTLDSSIMAESQPKYSMSVCNRFCVQVDIINNCDCYHIELDMTLINISRVNFKNESRPCALLPDASNDDYRCFQGVFKSYEEQTRKCDSCHLACSETVHSTTSSISNWPSNNYWQVLAAYEQNYHDIQIDDPTIGPQIEQLIKDNYLKVEVYYQSLNVQQIVQSPKVSSGDLFAALGGALALYLGIAIIMFFELIELMVTIILTYYDRYKEQKEEKDKVEEIAGANGKSSHKVDTGEEKDAWDV